MLTASGARRGHSAQAKASSCALPPLRSSQPAKPRSSSAQPEDRGATSAKSDPKTLLAASETPQKCWPQKMLEATAAGDAQQAEEGGEQAPLKASAAAPPAFSGAAGGRSGRRGKDGGEVPALPAPLSADSDEGARSRSSARSSLPRRRPSAGSRSTRPEPGSSPQASPRQPGCSFSAWGAAAPARTSSSLPLLKSAGDGDPEPERGLSAAERVDSPSLPFSSSPKAPLP
mmetsp:Transcript_114492/g.334728  ORF Transcript_114492/g.334728 Transcript_114492/m.334728 type:complete len:230 (-) Transcript_114492:237-926(-)